MSDDVLLTIPEAAKRMKFSRSQFYVYIQKGAIATVHAGRRVYIQPSALDDFVEWLKKAHEEAA